MSKLSSTFLKLPPVFFLFVLALEPLLAISQLPASSEREILLNLKQHWGNPAWAAAWNSSSSPCNWPEIKCSDDGSVTGLNLQNMNISGTLLPSFCDLKNLTFLDLSWNYFPGEFPTFLYNCANLQYLDLSQNCFVGKLPSDINLLSPSIKYIDVGANNFTGDIPPAIGGLLQLRTLNLYQNLFNGTFPSEIGDLENLEVLNMALNKLFLPAKIPAEFGKLKKLKNLLMYKSNLVGEIPGSFANLSSLVQLDLSQNNLQGPIPQGLFQLKNLSIVYLWKNHISGEIPTPIESMNLIGFDLSMNNLTGPIPEDIGKLKQLKVLNLFVNYFSSEVPPSISSLPSLTRFSVFQNRLNGTLPPEFGLHSKLEGFEVSDNQFTGNLPENLCSGGTLLGVVAFSNNLSGEIPKSLEKCNTLRTIQLYNNNFSGEVPEGLWTLFNISILLLSSNSLSGKLPGKLARNLSRLDVSNNKFSGEIPAGVSSWVNMVDFKASNNQISGGIPAVLSALSHLITLYLDDNLLTGDLPSTITNWKSLTTLNLARNKLSGQIPATFGSLPDLLNLDLSENHLTGEIPPQLGHLKLTILNLSSNNLAGKIPVEFDNLAYETSFLNNPNLCFTSTPIPNLRSCYTKIRNPNNLSPKILAIILVFAIILFLFTVVLTVFVVRDYQKKKFRRRLAGWKLTSFQRIDFSKANILKSLNENNLIGSGGSGKIYRVNVNRSGHHVAVKRIWNRKIDRELEKEFLAEVEILGMIKHSNIVKLLCCIASEDSKLLVYEYMENQSLDKWLHGKNGADATRLGWPVRRQIAEGAARGLCYMHHDFSQAIIHRDVKSSNILLDPEFNAKIADFGLARILAKRDEPNTMSAIAGSFGYMAPEYAYTVKVDEKIDVYSFGVVLLELVTGRKPQDGDKDTNLAEWAWRHYGDGVYVEEALDGNIKEPCYLEEMISVFKLGLMCTSQLPNRRPSMKEVLQILRRCGPQEVGEGKKTWSDFDVAPLLGSGRYLSSYKKSKRVSDEGDESIICVV